MKAFYSFCLNDEHSSGVVAMRFTSTRQALLFLILASVLALAACGKSDTGKVAASAGRSDAQETRTEAEKTKDEEHGKGEKKDEHGAEVRWKLSTEDIKTAGIKVEELKEQRLVDQVVL